ncbi:MAG: P-loop NTPase [Candidatus Muiribacteriota bacterium]
MSDTILNKDLEMFLKETKDLLHDDKAGVKKKDRKLKKTIAFASGKGGVGKTTLAVNLGLALLNKKLDMGVFDADLGMADGDILLGTKVEFTLMDYLKGLASWEEIVHKSHGLKLISAGTGVAELANIGEMEKSFIYSNIISQIDCDYLIVDTGAGISENTTYFLEKADIPVIVITPEPTSICDGYGIIKTLLKNNIKNEINVIINRAYDEDEANVTFLNIEKVVEKFYNKKINFAGFIPEDRDISYALFSRKPVYLMKDKPIIKFIEKVTGFLYNKLESE